MATHTATALNLERAPQKLELHELRRKVELRESPVVCLEENYWETHKRINGVLG